MKKLNYNEKIQVCGVTFDGIDEIIRYGKNKEAKNGVYVGIDSKLYPCFDSSDYAYENRYYWNFVFAMSKVELEHKLEALKTAKIDTNYNKLTEELHPMVYWEGESRHNVLMTEETAASENVPGNELKTTIFNLIILDESGSMGCIRKQTIMGCNEVLNTIKSAQAEHADTQNHSVSIYAFQSGGSAPSRYLIQNATPDNVAPITEKDYEPYGCTPLYDALGFTINGLRKIVRTHERAIGSVTIITDGMENSSHEYKHKQIADLIEELKKEGWNFNFIGANIDVEEVSHSLNIDNSMAFEQSVEGTKAMFAREHSSRRRYYERVSKVSMMLREDPEADFCEAMEDTSKDYFEEEK